MTGDTSPESRWWDQPFEMFQTNLREIDAGLDVEATLDTIQDHGADIWLINAGGIIANYPSDLEFHTRNLHLGRRASGDLLGDAVASAHARDMRLMARMDFSKIAMPIADAHPDWCFRSRAGDRQMIEDLVSVCPNGDYYQHRTFDILDEILDRYPVDGFFFNWFSFNEVDYNGVRHGVCHCEACRRTFAIAEGDRKLPADTGSTDWSRWRAFCRRTLNDLTGRIRDHIAERRPDAALILGSRSDIIFHEANNKIGRELWPSATGESVSAAKTVRPDKPVLVNSTAFVDMPYRMAGEGPHHVGQFFAQALARGANPSTYIMGPPGAIRYVGLPAAARVTRFHRRWRSVYDGLKPAATVALVRPDVLTQPEGAQDEFRGWYAALQEGHVPFDVLPIEGLVDAEQLGSLSRIRTFVLPDLGPLAADVIAALEKSRPDTAIVATGSSAFEEGRGQLRYFPGMRVRRQHSGFEETRSTYATDGDQVIPIYGDLRDLELTSDGSLEWRVLPQASFAPPERAYGHLVSEIPAMVSGLDGAGAQFAWTIGRTYREFGTDDLRRLMLEVVLRATGRVQVTESELPEQVELIVGVNGRRTVVHLVNLSGARRRGFGAPSPVAEGRLRLPASAGVTATSLVTNESCVTRREGDTLVIDLPTLDLFDVIVVEPRAVQSPSADGPKGPYAADGE